MSHVSSSRKVNVCGLFLLCSTLSAAHLPSPVPLARVIGMRSSALSLGHCRRCAGLSALAPGDDPYAILGVNRDASASQIKQAYRRLALRNHPDVATDVPDAQAKFARIADAYSVLSNVETRAKYDRTGRGGSSSGYSGAGSAPRSSSYGSSSPSNPAAAAAAAERQRRWREANPTPGELGDSFGALLGDIASAVGQVVGGGDWLSLLDELQLAEGAELQSLLRSTNVAMLKEELESARFVQSSLMTRIARLTSEVQAAIDDRESFVRSGAARGSMERSIERDLERDLSRRRERLANARRMQTQAESRESRINARLEELRRGPPPSSPRAAQRSLPSVEDELQRLKREMGK